MNHSRRTFLLTVASCGTIIRVAGINEKPKKEFVKRNVGIFIFPDAEVLDIAGPFEVFSVTSQLNDDQFFDVFTIGKEKTPVRAVNGLSINPHYDISSHPRIDIFIICGGSGTRRVIEDSAILKWAGKIYHESELTLSICSGARVVGKLGLLDHRPYCTHHQTYDHLAEIVTSGLPQHDKRFVQSETKLYTSGGISAGIDLSFFIVKKLLGTELARKTATYMEYNCHETTR